MSARQRSMLLVVVGSLAMMFAFGALAFSCGDVAHDELGFCGDSSCTGVEDCTTCERDCGACPAQCGDHVCGAGEDCSSCAGDCGTCTGQYCGNSACDAGETCGSCDRDCGACPDVCNDGACTGTETCAACAADCGACTEICANGVDDDMDGTTDEGDCTGGGY